MRWRVDMKDRIWSVSVRKALRVSSNIKQFIPLISADFSSQSHFER